MRPVVLTTETLHHAYFVRELARAYPSTVVFEETKIVTAPFPTAHEFEQDRDTHERAFWFNGQAARMADFAEVRSFSSINSPEAVSALKSVDPDVVVVVGTGRLHPMVIDAVPPETMINAHGGDPQEYRGLDSHLWAIYHRDFDGLVTTLHMVAPELDAGGIVGVTPVPLRRGMPIPELRQANTDVALQLTLDAFRAFEALGQFTVTPQRRKGRYYSFMPAVIKDRCVANFRRHCGALK